jgi:hypothetical protein
MVQAKRFKERHEVGHKVKLLWASVCNDTFERSSLVVVE